MIEYFVNELISSLYGKISDENLVVVKNEVQLKLKDYDVKKKSTEVIPWQGYFPECYKAYMVTKKIEGASDKSLKLYKLYIEDMLRTINKEVGTITTNDIKVYLYLVKKNRNISNRSLDSRRSILNSFFQWIAAEEYIQRNPMCNIKPIKYEANERKPLDDVELEMIRNSCKDIREKAIIELFYSTGCRVTELSNLNVSDIDFERSEVILFGKGNKHRKSFITARAMLFLKEYLDTRFEWEDPDALFVSERYPYRRLSKAGIEKIVGEIGDRAGVERLHPHLLRHTTATNALQHGMDVTQVQKLLGHVNVNTTMIYAKASSEDVKVSHKKYII